MNIKKPNQKKKTYVEIKNEGKTMRLQLKRLALRSEKTMSEPLRTRLLAGMLTPSYSVSLFYCRKAA
jgi:hypothetical protein